MSSACVTWRVEPDLGAVDDRKGTFVPLILELGITAGIKDSKLDKIPTMSKLITAQFNDSDRQALSCQWEGQTCD